MMGRRVTPVEKRKKKKKEINPRKGKKRGFRVQPPQMDRMIKFLKGGRKKRRL